MSRSRDSRIGLPLARCCETATSRLCFWTVPAGVGGERGGGRRGEGGMGGLEWEGGVGGGGLGDPGQCSPVGRVELLEGLLSRAPWAADKVAKASPMLVQPGQCRLSCLGRRS